MAVDIICLTFLYQSPGNMPYVVVKREDYIRARACHSDESFLECVHVYFSSGLISYLRVLEL